MNIGDRLRERRTELHLTRNQLAARIHITPSAIANYENGVSYPKPDILIALIIELGVDANYLYQDYISNGKMRTHFDTTISTEEKEAFTKYHELSEHGKRLVRMVIDAEYERVINDEWVCFPLIQPGIRKLHAGFLIQENPQTLKLKKKHVPDGTEFCFQIQIDRYEPVFKKHDILALQKTPASHNEMGLFLLNGIHYLKTLAVDGSSRILRALNVIEPDIKINADDQFSCMGRVLGKVYGSYEVLEEKVTE